jgi:energy-coupling factor transporter ATP-binding protein EcfA2
VRLHPEEPAYDAWRPVPIATVLGDARLVAVDGRSGSGKTTIAALLAATVPGAAVVHTDDVAWAQARFDWAELLRDGVLRPVRAGSGVSWTPPAWEPNGRHGVIEVPAGAPLVLVEGVGVSRRDLTGWFDLRLWVQSDLDEAHARGIERDGRPDAEDFWAAWMTEEVPFLAADRPWERADVIVAGRRELPYEPATELLVAGSAGRAER